MACSTASAVPQKNVVLAVWPARRYVPALQERRNAARRVGLEHLVQVPDVDAQPRSRVQTMQTFWPRWKRSSRGVAPSVETEPWWTKTSVYKLLIPLCATSSVRERL